MVSHDDQEREKLGGLRITSDGSLKAMRAGKSTGEMLEDSEASCANLKMVRTTLELIRLRHPHHLLLEGLSVQGWNEHMDYILGEEVRGA